MVSLWRYNEYSMTPALVGDNYASVFSGCLSELLLRVLNEAARVLGQQKSVCLQSLRRSRNRRDITGVIVIALFQ